MNYNAEFYIDDKHHSFLSQNLDEIFLFLNKFLTKEQSEYGIDCLKKQSLMSGQYPNIIYFIKEKSLLNIGDYFK